MTSLKKPLPRIESARVGVLDFDPQAASFECSLATKRILGLPEGEPASLDRLVARVAERDRQRVRRAFGEMGALELIFGLRGDRRVVISAFVEPTRVLGLVQPFDEDGWSETLRSSLGAVLGLAVLGLDECADPRKQQSCLSAIKRNAENMIHMLNGEPQPSQPR